MSKQTAKPIAHQVPPALAHPAGHKSPRGSDRVSVVLFSLAAFLLVLAVLGTQLKDAASSVPHRHVVVFRRVYRTTVVERVLSAGRAGPAAGTSVTQSVASSASAPSSGASASTTAPITRTS